VAVPPPLYNMKSSIDLIIVIPVGPTCKIEFILDTIDSIKYYVHCDYKIIISDDSHNAVFQDTLKRHHPGIIILKTTKNYGKLLGLYTTLSNAYRYALDEFNFCALLRLDTDALIIGHEPEAQILEFFKNNPSIGLAGRYVKGLSSPDQFGNVWQNGGREPYVAIAKLFTKFYVRHPFIYWRIRRRIFEAINYGYELGDLIFGGAYAFSRVGLEKLRDNNLLPMKHVVGGDLEEDHFFTMLMVSVGMGVGDLATGDSLFACAWKGLPASPETLFQANKKIIHSTRYWGEMKEDEIRKFFRDNRQSAILPGYTHEERLKKSEHTRPPIGR
jgi:hypothetical protein